ncbi:ComEA family DNA-binding protein [Thermoleptolyngbya sp. M55_K2018_002]|uniref:ComEA family DNA-binding protein n=1 Tax=Thermoleptolyngbya sp. M55_K2018_002 TaxID=2747808 RepID=UPI0019F1E3B0|nr:ComEA family DNA-binding protein [Thermoleptolyngbya sp. M55_K2018_002]HIK41212.1 ComEA family DNA-binding protein [Thermoleptolyngbya sp. M55_K2018_002]
MNKNWWSMGLRSGAQESALRSRLAKDPYYRFQSVEELQLAARLGVAIDVNQAGVDDWLRLPGLSIHQARSLSTLTQSGVHFHCLEDIAAALSLPVQRLRPLEPVLQFCYYDPESLCAMQPANPNTASLEALIRIPAIDLFLARAILHHRQRYGPYRNLADLQQRLALPPGLITELMHYLRF